MVFTRRGVLAGLSSAALSPLVNPVASLLTEAKSKTRICFFTDSHLPVPAPGDEAPEKTSRHWDRFRAALKKANSYTPSLFVFGGDNVMAVDQGQSEEHASAMFAKWSELIKEGVKTPHISVIGNHDIRYPKGVEVKDRKDLAVKHFSMANRYYKHEAKDWDFYLLDVFHPGAPTAIDAEQFSWLEKELAKSNKPSCLVSHAPFFGPSCQLDGDAVGGKKELRALLLKHDHAKLALSGHQHWLDRCELDHMTYLCGGAVSGAWWDGPYAGFAPAFLILDLESDGSFKSQTVFWEGK